MRELILKKIDAVAKSNFAFNHPMWEAFLVYDIPVSVFYASDKFKGMPDEILFDVFQQIIIWQERNTPCAYNMRTAFRNYMYNSIEVAAAVKPLIEQKANEGDYMKAHEYKVSSSLHETTAYHIRRILDGLPAIEEGTKTTQQ